jgi:hypothetical protein
MFRDRLVAAAWAILLPAASVWAQAGAAGLPSWPVSPGPRISATALTAPSVAERLREIAEDVAGRETISAAQADQAIILLTAAKGLNREARDIEPLLLRLAIRNTQKDYSEQMVLWLQNYVDESADRAVVNEALGYLLARLNSREQRKALLEGLVGRIGNRNPVIDSDLAMLLGLFMAEQGDSEAAKFYLVQAYTNNKYNKKAFAKLAELAADEIGPSTYLEHLRLVMREDPLDISAALNFAQYAERLQLYDVAAGSYRYCAALFRYLYPTEALPPHIYLPWVICCYNTESAQGVCLQIADNIRRRGQFDILLEAVAGRAAAKMGNQEQAQRIFQETELRARQLLQSGPEQGAVTPVRTLTPKQVAWFYCFASPSPEKALDWANRAYADEPDAPSAGALLAYALIMQDKLEWAKPVLASFEHNQIADLAQVAVYLSEGKKTEAVKTLQAAVAKDPGSLAAERARQMLREQGQPYVPSVDPATLTALLADDLGKTLVPQFSPPNEALDVQFNIRGNEFAYGSEIEATVAIINNGFEPLVVNGDSLFRGGLRIDARVTGDLQRELPNLVSRTIRTALVVPPGRSLTDSVKLSVGALGDLLLTYPQASVRIEFTLYLDPVTGADGLVSSRLVDLKPITVSVTRPGVDLTASYVRNRLNGLSSGQPVHKMRTAQLFTGLLKEQNAMAEQGPLYPYRYADWLPNMLRSALVGDSGLLVAQRTDEWVVTANVLADMLSLPLDQELATAVAKNLNHPEWPVRLMAMYLLACSPGDDFGKVLDWVAQNDANELVRSMALALHAGLPGAARAGQGVWDAPLLTRQ